MPILPLPPREVHLLRAATRLPFCHKLTGLGHPEDWPKGHTWVMLGDGDDDKYTCVGCRHVRSEMRR